jgi:hypothetical protein
MVAKGGNINAIPFGYLQDCPILLPLHFLAVNGKGDHMAISF